MHQVLESCKAFFLNSENTGKIKAHDSFGYKHMLKEL